MYLYERQPSVSMKRLCMALQRECETAFGTLVSMMLLGVCVFLKPLVMLRGGRRERGRERVRGRKG